MDAEQLRDIIFRTLDALARLEERLAPTVRRMIQSEIFPSDDEPQEAYRLRLAAMADAMALGIESTTRHGLSPLSAGCVADRPGKPTLEDDLEFIRCVLDRWAQRQP